MKRLLAAVASHRLTAYLTLSYLAFLVLLFVWSARIPGEVVQRIARLLPFELAYAAAFVHLALCLVFFWPAVRRRIDLMPPQQQPHDGQLAAPDDPQLAALARAHGFRWRRLSATTAVAHRNRTGPLGTLVSHAALLLLPLAFVVSRATRFEGQGWIVEGHDFDGRSRDSWASVDPPGRPGRVPPVAFHVAGVEASFWGERLFFTDLRALVEVPGESPAWMTLAQPLTIAGARVSLAGFNYTPAVELWAPDGTLAFDGDLRLRLFPPGMEDAFTLPGAPYRFFVRLYPDVPGAGRGVGASRGHSLGAPLFHVAAVLGKRLVAHGFVRPGEPFEADGWRLRFPSVRRGGDITVHRDLGEPLLWFALVLALAGTAWRILLPSSRVWVVAAGGGARVLVRDDAFSAGRGVALARAWGADVA